MRTLAKTVYTSSQFVLTVLFLLCVSISMLFAEFSANDTWYREYRESGPFISLGFIVFGLSLCAFYQYIVKSLFHDWNGKYEALIGFEKALLDLLKSEDDFFVFLKESLCRFSDEKELQVLLAHQCAGIIRSQEMLEDIVLTFYSDMPREVLCVFCERWQLLDPEKASLEGYFNRRLRLENNRSRLNDSRWMLKVLGEYVCIAGTLLDESGRYHKIGEHFVQYVEKHSLDVNLAHGIVQSVTKSTSSLGDFRRSLSIEELKSLRQGMADYFQQEILNERE